MFSPVDVVREFLACCQWSAGALLALANDFSRRAYPVENYDTTSALVLILGLGIGAQWLAWKLRFPAIVALLVTGLLAGPLFGWIEPHKALGSVLHPFIELSVAIILFEAGLALRLTELGTASSIVKRVVTIGIPFSLLLGTGVAFFVGNLTLPVALMFGAIAVISGPTVIQPLLQDVTLNHRLATCLRWEAVVNDPAGAILAVLIFHHLPSSTFGHEWPHVFLGLGKIALLAGLLGFGGGYILSRLIRSGWAPPRLLGAISLALVLLFYVAAEWIHTGAGLVVATVFGLSVGNMQTEEDRARMLVEKQYITMILISVLFITFSASITVDDLIAFSWREIVVLAAMLLFVRPAAIFVSTIGAGLDLRERLFLAWIGPRGVVAVSMAATYGTLLTVSNDYPDAGRLAPLILALSLASVVTTGMSMSGLAKKLKLLQQ